MKVIYTKPPSGLNREDGQVEDLQAQLAEAWIKEGYCKLYREPKAKGLDKAPKHTAILGKRRTK